MSDVGFYTEIKQVKRMKRSLSVALKGSEMEKRLRASDKLRNAGISHYFRLPEYVVLRKTGQRLTDYTDNGFLVFEVFLAKNFYNVEKIFCVQSILAGFNMDFGVVEKE